MAQTACSCTATSPVSRAASHRVMSVSRAAPRRARHHTSRPRRQAPRRGLARSPGPSAAAAVVAPLRPAKGVTSSCSVLVSSALLSCRLLRIRLLAMCRSLLPQQAACCISTSGNSAPAGARRFPQPVWTTHGCVRLRSDSPAPCAQAVAWACPRRRGGCQLLAERGGRCAVVALPRHCGLPPQQEVARS